MKFLVTGGNGFVGRALCAELIKRKLSVRAANRSVEGSSLAIESCSIGNIDGGTDWTDAVKDIDVVIHLAARVHVMKETVADPLTEFLEVNCHGTANLAQQAVRAGVKRLVYVSSIGVNGKQTYGDEAFSEADTPRPHNDYAISKWRAERALLQIAKETSLQVVIVRPPLIYGAYAKGNFPKLLTAIAQGIPLPLASAVNVRSFVYVENLVDALISCATHPAAGGQTYLVTDGEDISTSLLVEKMASALGCRCRSFRFSPGLLRRVATMLRRADQVDQLFGSLRVNDGKIRSELGWVPPYELDQGLHAVAKWYCQHQNRPST